jgi:hypothetical protein
MEIHGPVENNFIGFRHQLNLILLRVLDISSTMFETQTADLSTTNSELLMCRKIFTHICTTICEIINIAPKNKAQLDSQAELSDLYIYLIKK